MKGTINHFFAPSAKGLVGAMGRAALVLLCVLSAAGAWAQSTSGNFTVSGNTYTIQNVAGWDEFCNAVTAGNSFSGKTIVLAQDIIVTSMAGNGATGFQGTFNGGGHTLTLHYGSPEAHVDAQFVAPFPAVTGNAKFSNLNIDGYIYSTTTNSQPGVGGLIGHLFGNITIEDCTSAVEITSTTDRVGGFVGLCEHSVSFSNCVSSAVVHCSAGNNSGFVGWSRASGYTINFEGCLFNGKLLQTNGQGAGGGFVGWKGDGKTVYITNCLYAPAPLAAGEDYVSGGATFCCQHNDQLPANITNCYYTQAFGAAQGNQARAISGGEHVTLANAGTPVVTYTTSGITSYGTGIKYNNVFYAGVDDEVSLTLSSQQPAEGYSFSGYNATPDGATLTGSDANGWTLTMPDADVTIGAVYTPVTYSITYELGGGALPEGRANPESYTVESATFTLVNPERDGYVFAGWTGGGLSEPTKEVTIAKGSTTGDKTFTATWQMPPIAYIDTDGTTKACTNYTMLNGSESELAEGWYVADGTVSFDHQLSASDGDIHLILKDGAVMRIGTEESPVSDEGIVAYYYSISIHGQSTGESRGQLWINAKYNGIAAYYGNVEISGGTVEAKGTENCGIYAIQSDYDVSSISMTGATVTAEGAAFGIYTGFGYLTAKGCTINATSTNDYGHCIYSDDANITLTDCEVTATGNGSGIWAEGGNVEISGGTVEAKGTKVRGIFATRHFNGGSISMTGATVTAEGAEGGIWAEGGHLTAEDCTINATSTNGFGIYSYNGNITLTDCEVTATGGDRGIYAHGGNVEISGGQVTATATNGYGIYTDSSITLSWNAPTDFIEANSYSADGTITLAKPFTDGDGNIYSGVIDNEEDGTYAIDGKKLLPYIGDANGDNVVTIADVVMVVSYLVNGVEPEGFNFSNADVDGSGTVDTTDLRAIVDMILEE